MALVQVQAQILGSDQFGAWNCDAAQADVRRPGAVSKWRVLRDICDARVRLNLRDRALSVLSALLSFHPQTDLSADDNLVVFPSNAQLSARANGIAGTTLRENLWLLVQAGLIWRRDSPNGKRYARKGRDGRIEAAFGFDLSPLLARASELAQLAQEVAAERARQAALREGITLLRRDIRKLIEAAIVQGAAGDWFAFQAEYNTLATSSTRRTAHGELQERTQRLAELKKRVLNMLKISLKTQKNGSNDHVIRLHIQNQETEYYFELEPSFGKEQSGEPELRRRPCRIREDGTGDPEATCDGTKQARKAVLGSAPSSSRQKIEAAEGPAVASPISDAETSVGARHRSDAAAVSRPREALPLRMVLRACPEIIAYGRGARIDNWRDLMASAAVVRTMLGISPSAYEEACEAMGHEMAAVTIACILERYGHITSPGGYLRHLSAKASSGRFSVASMLTSLAKRAASAPRQG